MQLLYRGVNYEYNPPIAEMTEGEVGKTYQRLARKSLTVRDRARSLVAANQKFIKDRQQTLLRRSADEVGLVIDASHYWDQIQGKVHPDFRAVYDRSNVAFS